MFFVERGLKILIDVYICEDVKEQREKIVRYVNAAILIHEYDMKIKIDTCHPDEIIEKLRTSENMGLYFLDIELKTDRNGLRLAQEIREYDPRGFIVFITSHSEMSYLTFQYKVEALDYILKDEPQQLQSRICTCMEHVNNKYMNINRGYRKTISITKGGRKIILEYNMILFFETSGNEHKIIVHTMNKSIEFFGKMKDIEARVANDFIRCHRSYLVNKKNIKEIKYADKVIVMINGAVCPVSHRMLNRVKNEM